MLWAAPPVSSVKSRGNCISPPYVLYKLTAETPTSDLYRGTKRDINQRLRMSNRFYGLLQLLLENNCMNALYVEDRIEIECSLLLFANAIPIAVSN